MSSVDIIIVCILLWGAWRGWKSGFIKELFSTCGFVVGLILAALFYSVLGEHLSPAFGSGSMASFGGCVLAFILIWVMVPILFGLIANALTKGVKAVHVGGLNSLLGLVVGVAKYFILISIVFSAMAYVGILSEEKKQASVFYPYITVLGNTIYENRSIVQDSPLLKDDTVYVKRQDAAK
ncbi:MAG: CvpA family protein [Bacteroidaceae bacterium]|nr:CvpA family protein [Bacteroidaceae bacterium]MBR4782280.1 CvpA family protein [Bacteroidaceae bacterium]